MSSFQPAIPADKKIQDVSDRSQAGQGFA